MERISTDGPFGSTKLKSVRRVPAATSAAAKAEVAAAAAGIDVAVVVAAAETGAIAGDLKPGAFAHRKFATAHLQRPRRGQTLQENVAALHGPAKAAPSSPRGG